MATHSTATPQDVIDAYSRGTRTRDIALLRSIFHDAAVMTGWRGPQFVHGSPEPFFAALEANEVGDDYAAQTTALVVTERIAVATTEEQNLLGLQFTNHFHLAQLDDGSWRITSKLFRNH